MTENLQFDMDAGVDELSKGLGLGGDEQPIDVDDPVDEVPVDDPVDAPVDENIPDDTEEPRAAPKSWAKEQHEVWGKLPKEAQDYIELREKQILDGIAEYKESATYGNELRKAIEPYREVIEQSGANEAQAISHLMQAHVRLTQGTRESRLSAYQELGKILGLGEVDPNTPQPDPKVQELEQRFGKIEQTLTQRQQAEQQAEYERRRSEVDAFANDNPYFDEVADHVAKLIKAGYPLKEAYDTAVWANPVTREKEQTRLLTEKEAARKQKAEEDARKAKAAKSSNVNGRDTTKAPTEPKGKMFDDMPNILEDIKSRH